VCRTPHIPPTRQRREPEKPPCPSSGRHGVDLEFGSSVVYLPDTEAAPTARKADLAGEASANCAFPDAALPQLPIAMFITNPRQIPLAASLESGERRELIQELLNYRID
jgi:hypothetical protein